MQTAISTTQDLAQRIMRAQTLPAALPGAAIKKAYREAVKLLHPDLCKLPMAAEALIRLNELKKVHEQGQWLVDDAGPMWTKDNMARFSGHASLLATSFKHYKRLKKRDTEQARHFQLYLPESMELDAELTLHFRHRTIPLYGLQLPQEHVNWVLSRLLEIAAWFAQEGIVHGGINPKSVFLVPETHGIIISSFYHLKRIGQPLETISASYQNWYPATIFTKKVAETAIDLEGCKRTAAYLLGDTSGLGVKLKKTHLPAFVDFLLDRHTNAYDCYREYRALLKRYFEQRFVPLHL